MDQTKRRFERVPVNQEIAFYWEDALGEVHSTRPKALEASDQGILVVSAVPIDPGTEVCVEAAPYGSAMEAEVRSCIADGATFRIAIEFRPQARKTTRAERGELDYYEILQLSPNADMETVHRVYRIMAARFHPDNPNSGDEDRFLLLSEAYRVLSNPERRAQYDLLRSTDRTEPAAVFQSRLFVDQKEGEMSRRLGVLCLLYTQRRRRPERPSIALMDLEATMAIPREYLEFTLWYLKQKRYIEMNEGADFMITAAGIDFVEEHALAREILLRLAAGGELQTAERERDPSFTAVG